jgi:hypothetical protein
VINLKLERFADRQLNSIVSALRTIVGNINENPFSNGRFVTQTVNQLETRVFTFSGSDQVIAHGLGRTIQGLIEVNGKDCGVPPRVYMNPGSEDLTKQVNVSSATSGSCWIWVF